MRVLVTGAAGLIGSAIAGRLESDHEVVGLDLKAGPSVRIVGDCFNVAEWRRQVGRLDAVVHVAALHAPHVGDRTNEEFRRTNVDATSRILDLAAGSGATHFVLTSTTSLYGHSLDPKDKAVWVDETLQPSPRDIYDETKLAAEELVASAGESMTVTSLRMSRCFPEPADVMAWYRLHRGIDRRDVAEAHAAALAREGPPATFIVGASTPFQRDDCEQLLIDARAVIERRCPGLIERMAARGWNAPRSIDRVYDSGRAARDMGFAPCYGVDSCIAGDWDPLPSR